MDMKNYSELSSDALSRSVLSGFKIAIVSELLGTCPDADRVLKELLAVCPQAEIFALADFIPEEQRGFLGERRVKMSFIQNLPFARKHFSWYLALMPFAIEQFDLSNYDFIISNSNGLAKGVISRVPQPHLSYVHSSIDYAAGWPRLRALSNYLRRWDIQTANGVDHFIASSSATAQAISETYGRCAEVIYPPVDVKKSLQGQKSRSVTAEAASSAERFRREFRALLASAMLKNSSEAPSSERVRSGLPRAPTQAQSFARTRPG
jgi:Glycosyltransferase Family 4